MKIKNKFVKDSLLIAGTSVGLGVMGSVVERAGGNAGAINTLSGFMPAIAMARGGQEVLKHVKKIKKR